MQTKEERLRYDAGNGRTKHQQRNSEAGFIFRGGMSVGICSPEIGQKLATRLLRSGVPCPRENPKRIYAVFRGVIYEAMSSGNNGWHGYPWKKLPGRMVIPRYTMKILEDMASQEGFLTEFKNWIKKYG